MFVNRTQPPPLFLVDREGKLCFEICLIFQLAWIVLNEGTQGV